MHQFLSVICYHGLRKDMEIVSLIFAQMRDFHRPYGAVIFTFPKRTELEEYMKELIGIIYLATCNVISLMEGFWIAL